MILHKFIIYTQQLHRTTAEGRMGIGLVKIILISYNILVILVSRTKMLKPTGALDIKQKKQQPHQDVFFNKKIVAPEKLKILVLSGNDIIS